MSQVMAFFAALGIVAAIALFVWIAMAATTDVPSFYEGDNDANHE